MLSQCVLFVVHYHTIRYLYGSLKLPPASDAALKAVLLILHHAYESPRELDVARELSHQI